MSRIQSLLSRQTRRHQSPKPNTPRSRPSCEETNRSANNRLYHRLRRTMPSNSATKRSLTLWMLVRATYRHKVTPWTSTMPYMGANPNSRPSFMRIASSSRMTQVQSLISWVAHRFSRCIQTDTLNIIVRKRASPYRTKMTARRLSTSSTKSYRRHT